MPPTAEDPKVSKIRDALRTALGPYANVLPAAATQKFAVDLLGVMREVAAEAVKNGKPSG
jgi:hypothetical protein